MNVIKKVLLAFTILFALAGCGSDALGPKEAVEMMQKAGSNPSINTTQNVQPYIGPEDIAYVKLYGSVSDLTRHADFLRNVYGLTLTNYVPPTIDFDKLIFWYWCGCFVGLAGICLVQLIKGFTSGAIEGVQKGSDSPFKKSLYGVIYNFLIFGLCGFLLLNFSQHFISILFSAPNALGANLVNGAMDQNKRKIVSVSNKFNMDNDIAEVIMMRKLEEIRTSSAKSVRYTYHMLASDAVLDGNSRSTTFPEFAAYQTSMRGIEYATNINRTVTWVDVIVVWAPVIGGYNFWTAEKYITDFQLYGKSNGGIFINDILNFPTSNFRIGLGKDVVEFNDDFTTNDSNSLKRRNTIAAAMNYSGSTDVMLTLDKIQKTIATALTADDQSYIANEYQEVYTDIKNDFKAAYKSVEMDILSFESDAQRVEITSSAIGLYTAKLHGISKDETFIKMYNWLDKPALDWLAVNCADNTFNYNVQKSTLDALNSSSRGFYNYLNEWGRLDKACIVPNGNKYDLLTLDSIKDTALIKAKYINAKSHAQAMKIYFNIVKAAAKDAYAEIVNDVSNSNQAALKKQLLGVVGLPLQFVEIINSKHSKDVIANRIDNAVSYVYTNAGGDDNFVDEVAVFGTPENKNYVKESDQTQIMGAFKPIKFGSLFDNNSMATGNIASLNQYESNLNNGFEKQAADMFTDVVLGPVDDVLKDIAGLPQSMNIADGLVYCDKTGCRETFKPSIYEAVVVSGRKFTDTGMKCIGAIAVAKGANDLLDFGDTANAASSGGIAKASTGAKTGGKVIKMVTATVAATASAAEIPCYAMTGSGFVNGYVMPMTFSVSLFFSYLGIIIAYYGLMMIIPLAILIDAYNGNHNLKKKAAKHLLGFIILPFVLLAGTLLSFSLLLLPAYPLVRMMLEYGFGPEGGLIAGIMSGLAVSFMMPLMFKYSTNISKELTNTILQFLEIGMNINAAERMSDGFGQAAAGAVAAHKVKQLANIAQMPVHEFVKLKEANKAESKAIAAREGADARRHAMDQVRSRQNLDVKEDGKKLDDTDIADPKFDSDVAKNKDKGDDEK